MPLGDPGLAGKVAIVTGAGQGIGRGIALALAKEGARITILERDAETGPRTVDEVRALGGDAVAHTGSVRDRTDCEAAVATAVDRFGGVDVLVNNAQQLPTGPLDDCTD